MTSGISLNPGLTTNAIGSFSTQSDGFVQGVFFDDPAIRYELAGGTLAANETIPMWGGVAIYEDIPTSSTGILGGTVGRATTLANITGISVFNQASNWLTTPQSEAPSAGSGMGIPFFRMGSGARITMACDPALVNLDGGLITQQVSIDLPNMRLVPYTAGYADTTITGAVWESTAGGQTTFAVSTDLTSVLAGGDDINVAGVVSTGGTGVGYNGPFTVVSLTSSHVVVTQVAASSPGTYSSGGKILAAGGAFPCKVLAVNNTNCKVIAYDAVNNLVHWSPNGACALIQI